MLKTLPFCPTRFYWTQYILICFSLDTIMAIQIIVIKFNYKCKIYELSIINQKIHILPKLFQVRNISIPLQRNLRLLSALIQILARSKTGYIRILVPLYVPSKVKVSIGTSKFMINKWMKL